MSRRTRVIPELLLSVLAAAASASAQGPAPNAPDPYGRPPAQLTASLKVDATPRETQVFIDGYYAGIADDFDGAFQQLRLEPGDHDVQLFLPGYRLFVEHVTLQNGTSIKVRHAMERLATGEAEPRRPMAVPRPPRPFAPAPDASPAGNRGPSRPSGDLPDRSPYGSLSIRVQPGDAEVLVDDTRWDSPVDGPLLVQLAPGAHTVEVRKSGFRTYLTEVTVRGGETTPLNISLSKGQ